MKIIREPAPLAPARVQSKFAGQKKVGPSGPTNARLLVVGEAPGVDEETQGQPFVGKAGELLRDCMTSVGIDPAQVFFTNLAKLRPANNEIHTYFDDQGRPNEILTSGLVELRDEIATVKPDLIIPLGSHPLKLLTNRGTWSSKPDTRGYSGIGLYRGYAIRGNPLAGGAYCLPSYHPSAALRNYPLKHILRTDLAKAKRYIESGGYQRPRKAVVVLSRGPDRDAWAEWLVSPAGTLSPLIRPSKWNDELNTYAPGEADHADVGEAFRVPSGEFLTADIEYIGSKLLCVGFTRHSDVAIVFQTGSTADIADVRSILLSGIPTCFQNGMFDCSILEWFYDIPALKFLKHDTMYAMHAAYIEMQKDLGFIGSMFTDLPPWWQHIDKKYWKGVSEGTQSITSVMWYNGPDVMSTHEAMEKMLADELTDPAFRKTYEFEMSLVAPLWKIGRKGVPVDTAKLEHLRTTLEKESAAFLHGIEKLNGSPVNTSSPPQVAAFVYDKLGVPKVGPKTPAGRWKMDDSTLASLILKCRDERQRVGIKMVREARERISLISKFCDIELDTDGRMRCHYDPAKTETGRLSSRKFYPTGRGANLQNIPRDGRVRSVFIPDPGHIFGYADLKSAESFVVAHITGDPEMLRLHSPEFMDGSKDGHKYVASFLLGKPMDLLTKDERYLGKRVRHAGNYGMSWKKLMDLINADAQETGVSVDAAQAKSLINRYRQLHPGLQSWWSDIQAELWRTHTLFSLHGRKRVFYGRPDAILPEAIAYAPQSTVADTLNMGLLKVAASEELQDWGFEILLQVHDAIGFQIPEKFADRALGKLPTLMDVPIQITRRGVTPYEIHIPVDIQVGYNWGEFDPKNPEKNPNGLKGWKGAA